MSIITEILHGTWLLESPDLGGYKKVAETILSGGIINDVKPECYSVLAKQQTNTKGQTESVDQVSVISMIGEVTKRSGMCNIGADLIAQEFLRADADPEIKGHIFYIDGPGGNADAMPTFQQLKSQLTKPVVALVDRACSLHYWAAVELSEYIMMNNTLTAEVGSIGAMIMFEKPTNELIIVRPEESADKNQGFVEAMEGNTELLQQKLKPLAIAFQNAVKTARPKIKAEDLKGKTFYAEEAVEKGLADEIGSMEKAYNLVLAKAELRTINQ